MAPRRKIRQGDAQLAFEALSIEGGLLSPEWLAKVAQLQADHQAATDYRIPKGLNLRDEIGRYWRIGQAHWSELQAGIKANAEPQALADRFVLALLREVLGFAAVTETGPVQSGERTYPVGHRALEGRVPVVIAPAGSGLDTLAPEFGDGSRRRSAFGLAQEYLNADEKVLWGIATDANTLRILRDNASLTRPAWIEADLARIFAEERYADFAALWLLTHETRFGTAGHPLSDCPLEVWRAAGREEGTRAREYLRQGVEEALEALGKGFLSHPENQPLRAALQAGNLTRDALFQQLLRLVYRLIFLLTAEERGVLHPPDSDAAAKALYEQGYGLRRLRDRAVRRSAHDRFADLWEGLKIVLRGVARGEPRLALPALGGLFDADQCPDLDAAKLENRALLAAVFKLSWLRWDSSLSRVNWRDMGPEELGSVYESLLELVPVIPEDGRGFSFATGDETKGNARKTTGSYYTPDSLVQVLLDSALEPVVQQTIAAHPDKPAEALLELSIVDPACGSGHFLLAAARRLAAHVARLQAHGTPSAAEYRHALRQVVSRCLYGVDLNQMAVELCRVSLWMEAVEPGRPLSFLDSHVQQGNALLGATPELMVKGVPTKAFEPIEGDDKKTASLLKKKNDAALEGQRGLDSLWVKPADAESAEVAKAVAALEAAPDGSLEDVAGKEAQWEGLQRSLAFTHQKFVADAWCAAFVWPKPPTEPKKLDPVVAAAPTNDLWRQIRDGQGKPPAETVKTVAELAGQYHFFHWHLAFPQVFARGGFDVVLGNPPWERVNLSEKEFFASRNDAIAKAPNAALRKRLIAELPTGSPQLWSDWCAAVRVAHGQGHLLRNSGRYPLTGKGDVNTFAVFAEHNFAVLSAHGRAGFIVPTGLATDDATKEYFGALVSGKALASFFSFENEEFVFPSVHHAFKFALISVDASRSSTRADLLFFARQVGALADRERHFSLSQEEFALLKPNTLTCPTFRSRRDADLAISIYRRNPVLVRERDPNGNPWSVEIGRMFHSSDDAELFVEDARGEHTVRLYESKCFSQYDHRFASFGGGDYFDVTHEQRADPRFAIVTRYSVDPRTIPEKHRSKMRDWSLAYRRITNATNERALLVSVLPESGLLDSANLIGLPTARRAAELMAALNSLAADYCCRQSIGGTNLHVYVLQQIPVPPITLFDAVSAWSGTQQFGEWVRERVLELTYTSWDVQAFGRDIGYGGPPFRWDPERRFLLRAELDAAFFHLYGISHEDADYILETFPIVKKNDERAHGEYRTKRVILEIYDAMAEAIRTGVPYHSRLDPAPADPRVAHAPRAAPQAAKPVRARDLPDAAWQRPRGADVDEVGVVLAALLKGFGTATPVDEVRLAAALALRPALALPSLNRTEAKEWCRLVGDEAEPLAQGVTAIAPSMNRAWGQALRHMRANRILVEDSKARTWAPGAGLDAIDTEGWADGRARWVVELLRRRGATEVLEKVDVETRRWVNGAEAA
ncbi:MAG TPA: N-6 DNA methylase [Gemmatimonadaceae bacterium]|nr:N-6 DNA methylase [Gemmatimonadaceae bacterium]